MWKGAWLRAQCRRVCWKPRIVRAHVPVLSGRVHDEVGAVFRSPLRVFFDDVLDQLDACITVEAVFWVDLLDRDRLKIHRRSVRVLGLAGDGHGGIWELTCSNRSHAVCARVV